MCRTYLRRRAACPEATSTVRTPYAYQPCRTYRVPWHHRRRGAGIPAGGQLNAAARGVDARVQRTRRPGRGHARGCAQVRVRVGV
eukprot:scaffold83706_cov75-Phaeocystis_antarctica.AAC.2